MSATQDVYAVVAGATGALGGAITRKLVDRGLTVYAVARDQGKLEALAGEVANIIPVAADLGDNAAIDTIKSAVTHPVKMLVQAVGLPLRPKDQPFDPSVLGIGVNIKCGGLMRLTAALDDKLVRGSRLVALAGYHGFEPDPTAIGPGVVNPALAGLMRMLSDGYGRRGVSTHLVSPGPVDTDRIRKLAADSARQKDESAEEILDGWRKESTFGELISLDQVAWAVSLLLDDEADCMHGGVLYMDGGRRKAIF